MGIKNLLKFSLDVCERGNMNDIRGKRLAIDMSCFIYKALYHEEKFLLHLDLYMKMFLRFSTKVYLVFDGKAPAAKRDEQQERQRAQERHLERHPDHKTPRLTPEVIGEVIRAYGNNRKIAIVFAPQESDGQLAYLSRKDLVDYIVTEDSDLIVYGCPRIIFKAKNFLLTLFYFVRKFLGPTSWLLLDIPQGNV